MLNKQVTAYHEAGHAIMHVLMDIPFNSVTIIETDDYLGVVKWNMGPSTMLNLNLGSRSREIAALARDAIKVLLAGSLAEEILTGHYNEVGASSDLDEIERIAFYQSRNPEAYIRRIKGDVRQIIKQNWLDVTKLANVLLEKDTLSSVEVYTLLGKEIRTYRDY